MDNGSFIPDDLLYRCGRNCGKVVGTLMLIARLFDGVSDLFMGVIIDKTNTRWGKARPWVLWSAPPLVVSLIMIFTVPNIGANGKAIYIFACIYFPQKAVCFTASNLSYNTMLSLVTTSDMTEM